MKTFVNLKLVFLFTLSLLVQIARAQTLQLQPLTTFGANGNGSILPGQLPYLTDGSTNPVSGSSGVHELQRSMAYNPATGHLLVLSRTNTATGASYYVGIINATNGADVGTLDLGTAGFGANNGFDFDTIAVADDGTIYVCDLTGTSLSSGFFNLYHWASESSSQDFIYQGDPGNGNTNSLGRWGDTMTVTGTGINTKILVASRGNVAAILTPNDPSLTSVWTATTLQTDIPITDNGSGFGYDVAFGTGNTFWAKVAGSKALYQLSYNTVAGTATTLHSYSNAVFPSGVGPLATLSSSNLLASLEATSSGGGFVRLHDISNLANPPVLLDRKAWATNEAVNGINTGSVMFGSLGGSNVLYVLNSDNGIMAFGLVSGPAPLLAPVVTLNPVSETVSLANNAAPFTGVAEGTAPFGYQWYFNVNTPLANATNASLTITNVQPANFGSYYFIVTNNYGSATSAVATLTEAISFKNGVIYEPFNYPAGLPLQNLGGWVTNTASVAVQVQGCYIAAGNLTVPGLTAPSGNHYLWASNVTVRLPFGTQTNGPLYFSFAYRGTNYTGNTATEDPIGGLAYSSGTTLYPKVDSVWTDANHYSVGVAKGTGVGFRVTDSQVFTGTDTVFIVCCFYMTNGNTGADIAQLWVNPNPATFGAALPPPPNCVTNTGSGGADPGANGVDRISWRGGTIVQHEVDEVRVGFTWAAVTPPPPVYLAAQKSGNSVVVSWPTNAVGYTLIGETSLTSAAWTTNTPIVVQGTNNTFTLPSPTGQQFFRLTR